MEAIGCSVASFAAAARLLPTRFLGLQLSKYQRLDKLGHEFHGKWEDLRSVLEAAALLPLEDRRALPDYAGELEDLQMWI